MEMFLVIFIDRTDKSVDLKADLSDAFPEYKEDKFIPDGLDTSFQLTRFTAFEYYLVHERTDGNIVLLSPIKYLLNSYQRFVTTTFIEPKATVGVLITT